MRRRLFIAVLAVSSACTGRPPPMPLRLSPSSAPVGVAVNVAVLGKDFAPFYQVNLDRPEDSVLNATFVATLSKVGLAPLAWVDGSTVRGRLPGDLPIGRHALTVTDASGGVGRLADAFEVTAAPNVPPTARLTLSPRALLVGSTVTGSATGSVDPEDALSALTFEWDWEGDGAFENSGPTATHTFTVAGVYTVTLQVTDTLGARGQASAVVVVTASASDIVTVTTGADEANAGATPANPRGAGLSLREAVAYADAQPGTQAIVIPPGTVVRLASQLNLDDTTGVAVLGDGSTIDGAAIPPDNGNTPVDNCLSVGGRFSRLESLEIKNCPRAAIEVRGRDTVVARNRLHDNGLGAAVQGTNNTFGPGNEVFSNRGDGVNANARVTVLGNVLRTNTGAGIALLSGADDSTVVANTVSACARGIEVQSRCSNSRLWHNTLHGNTGAGILVDTRTSGHSVFNNIVSTNGGWGLDAVERTLGQLDGNDLFGNTLGGCRACGDLGPLAQAVEPGYVDALVNDLRLWNFSPLVDAALDLGLDRNGTAPGNFDGASPDLGAYETH